MSNPLSVLIQNGCDLSLCDTLSFKMSSYKKYLNPKGSQDELPFNTRKVWLINI